MPSFNKRHDLYIIRFSDASRDPKEKSESMPPDTPKPALKQIEGKMNAAYYGGEWDPWKLSWKEYQRQKAMQEAGVTNTSLTVGKAVKLYIKDMILQNSFGSEATRVEYENLLNRFSEWCDPATFTCELTPEHGLRWLKSQPVAQSTKNTYGAILTQFYKYLVGKGFTARPLTYRGKTEERHTKIKYITEAQKDQICQYYRANREDIMKRRHRDVPEWMDYDDLINILFYQGMRKGEIFDHKIRRRDVSLLDETIRITGKGNKTRIVSITPPAAPYLKKAVTSTSDPSTNLFPSSYRSFFSILKKLAKKSLGSEYDWMSPHNLRHSCATYWVRRGARVVLVKKLLGHSKIETTMVYTEITDDTSRNEFKSVYNRDAKITKIG